MTQAEDGKWGVLENGTWNGLIGNAVRGETDFILNRMTMSSEKNWVVDFTLPLVNANLRSYIKLPDADKITWRSYMQPFSLKLWLALCGTISVIAVILAMVYNRTSAVRVHPILCLIDSLLCVYGTFCSQGTYTSPTSASSRLILLSNFLSSFILVSSYSAFIISYLTVQKVEMPFRDLAGMLDDGTYKFSVLAHSTQLTMFKNTSDKQRTEVYKKLIAPIEQDLPSGTPVGLTTICSKKMTFFTLDDVVKSYMKDVPCRLVTVPDIFYPISIVITMNKNNPYRGAINNLIMKLKEGGILSKLHVSDPISDEGDNKVTNVSLSNTLPLFFLLAAGLTTAFVLLVLEVNYFVHKSKVYIN